MDKLEELKKQRAELDKKIEELEYAEFPFKEGDEYWGLNSDGSFSKLVWDNGYIDKSVLMLGNAFRTLEEARLEADRRDLLHRFKMFRDKCNGYWKPNFTICDNKYFIEKRSGKIDVNYIFTVNAFILFGYFKNEEDAERAIELFGDEIKELFIDCECD